jgi:protein-S-isoprenylcysteine O-methyltransferase Ste14
MKDPGGLQIALAIINLIAMYGTARTEERELIRKFGPEYADYMRESKMFIPFIL